MRETASDVYVIIINQEEKLKLKRFLPIYLPSFPSQINQQWFRPQSQFRHVSIIWGIMIHSHKRCNKSRHEQLSTAKPLIDESQQWNNLTVSASNYRWAIIAAEPRMRFLLCSPKKQRHCELRRFEKAYICIFLWSWIFSFMLLFTNHLQEVSCGHWRFKLASAQG